MVGRQCIARPLQQLAVTIQIFDIIKLNTKSSQCKGISFGVYIEYTHKNQQCSAKCT